MEPDFQLMRPTDQTVTIRDSRRDKKKQFSDSYPAPALRVI
jgi:hypothetical protein